MNHLQTSEIMGQQYTIEWFFTADLKFLALCSGIQAANARFACVWVNVHRKIDMIPPRGGQ